MPVARAATADRVAAPAVPPSAAPAPTGGTASGTVPGTVPGTVREGVRKRVPRPRRDVDALAGLPWAYRSRVSGVLRVGAALLFILAVGTALRAAPAPEDVARATGGGPVATDPVATGAGATAAAGETAGSGVAAASRHPGPPAASGLRVVLAPPAGVRFVPVTSPVTLHAEVSDERGGGPGGVDVTWQISSTETGRTVFRGRGADLGLPPGALGEGIYHVLVRALDGQREATDLGVLVATGDRAPHSETVSGSPLDPARPSG